MHFFIGDGSHYMIGVPMRDLSNPEWEALDEDTRKALHDAKLFTGKRPEGHIDTHPDKVAEAAEARTAPRKTETGVAGPLTPVTEIVEVPAAAAPAKGG
jgi:hypothetical protein